MAGDRAAGALTRVRAAPSLALGSALLAAALTATAYWPGLVTWDSVRQYGEALNGPITDWHPPAMQWLWRQLIAVHPGPAPMLLVQLALYWGGLLLIATAARRDGRRRLGWALLACGLWPIGLALTGMILKDCLMAGALLVAAGLIATRGPRGGGVAGVVAGALLLFAAALRFNAFLACLPLMVAAAPVAWRRSWPRLALTSVVAVVALTAALPLANRLIGAEPTGVGLSLVIFDLGGITEHSAVDAFPDALEVRDAVAVNHRCYRPGKWDSYSDWVAPECPLGFTAWNDNVDPAEGRPYAFWLRAVLAHPFAYAAHRLTHFAINTRLLPVADAAERPVPHESAPNAWGFRITPNPLTRAIDTLAVTTAHTPLGWPIVAIALGLGALIAGRGSSSAWLIVPLALSSLLYGLGYLVFSVASELRYHLWTELAAFLATVMVLAQARAIGRRRLVLAYAPAAITVVACIACRVALVAG